MAKQQFPVYDKTMASSLSHLFLLKPPLSNVCSTQNVFFLGTPPPTASLLHSRPFFRRKPPTKIPFAITESDSPKSLDPDPKSLLQELVETFVLPADYFSKLPRDLRLDLNDAAFDLSNGPVKDECGKELGEILLNISRAWELADASTSADLVSKLPMMVDSLTDGNKSVSIR